MKRISPNLLTRLALTILTVGCLLSLNVTGQAQEYWRTFNSAEGNFKVSMPSAPDVLKLDTPKDIFSSDAQILTVNGNTAEFFVMTAEFTEELAKKVKEQLENPDEVFLAGWENGLEKILKEKGTYADVKPITLGGMKGREARFESLASIFKFRVYYSGRRFYVIGMRQPFLPNTPPEIQKAYGEMEARFFNSFSVKTGTTNQKQQQVAKDKKPTKKKS
jgi:hypothetical protein